MPSRPRLRAPDLLIAAAAAVCLAVGWLSRRELSPDGVAYLDLAQAWQLGRWHQLIQGYWSPLLPWVIGVIGTLMQRTGTALITLAHSINVVAALAALAAVWCWSRHGASRQFTRGAVVALMLASWGPPRIEAVTPDLLLLAILAWLSYELALDRPRRWPVSGLLLGIAFLVKTSTWPWLIATIPVRLATARDAAARRRVGWSSLLAAGVMAVWVVPLSRVSGQLTFGSAGRLNASWYIDASSSRLPDIDLGDHAGYRHVRVDSTHQFVVARFDDAAIWTYQPWGDPTAWAKGITQATGRSPGVLELMRFWLRNALLVFAFWLAPMFLAMLLPLASTRTAPKLSVLWRGPPGPLTLMLLGLAGLLQFVAVHPEPRLIAPFALMLALGTMAWWWPPSASNPSPVRAWPGQLLAWSGVIIAGGFAANQLLTAAVSAQREAANADHIADIWARASGESGERIAIIGPAAPLLADAYRAGARVAMQIPPRSVQVLATLPPDTARRRVTDVLAGQVAMAWETGADGAFRALIIPPVAPDAPTAPARQGGDRH